METATETLMAQFMARASDWVTETLKRVGERAMGSDSKQKLQDEDLKTAEEQASEAQDQSSAWRQPVAELMEMVMAKFSLAFVSALVQTLTGAEKEAESSEGDGSA